MDLKNQSKSLLFKERYYPISFKLSFISKSNFIQNRDNKYIFHNKLVSYIKPKADIKTSNKFILDNLIIISKYSKCYRWGFKYHRLNKAAFIMYHKNGNIKHEEYCIYDKFHRENGPAIIDYYENGNIQSKKYLINDKFFRLNKPAIISYYENGVIKSQNYYM